jgi:hypothetical protein
MNDDDDLPIRYAGEEPLTFLDYCIIIALVIVIGAWFFAGFTGWPFI